MGVTWGYLIDGHKFDGLATHRPIIPPVQNVGLYRGFFLVDAVLAHQAGVVLKHASELFDNVDMVATRNMRICVVHFDIGDTHGFA